jgi:hypothetical protein
MNAAKPSKQTIIDFLIKEIALGKERGPVLSKTVKKWQMSDRTFDRHWKIANQQHQENQSKIKEAVAEVDVQAAIEARKKEIMTADERKEYLTKLVKGDVKVPYTEVKWNPDTKKFVKHRFVEQASHTARISAISELNKMDGDYAPTKIAPTDGKGNDLPVSPVFILPPGLDINLPSNLTEDEPEHKQ